MARVFSAVMALALIITAIAAAPLVRPASIAEAATISWQAGLSGNTENNLRFVSLGDGTSSVETVSSKAAYRVSSAGYLYFFPPVGGSVVSAGDQFARIDIDYFDEDTSSQSATGRSNQKFRLQYASTAAGGFSESSYAFLGGTGSGYRTASFFVSDAKFSAGATALSNSLFRIVYQSDAPFFNTAKRLAVSKITVTTGTSSQQPDFSSASSVTWSPSTENGIGLAIGFGDGYPGSVTAGGRSAFQVSSSGYAYFDVADSYLSSSNTSTYDSAEVTVSYFDNAYGRFFLTYDSTQDNSAIIGSGATSSATPSFQSDGIQTNNIVYMTNSQQWMTYTFLLNNLKFGNGSDANVKTDFRIVYATDTSATTANRGTLLAYDAITITRKTSASHVDRKSRVVGNTGSFGDPEVVWTRLANKNVGGHGLYQLETSGDGATTASGSGSTQGRKAGAGYIYFDVNDNFLFNSNAKNVLVTVDYLDAGTGTMRLEYDGASSTSQATENVTLGNTNAFKSYTFALSDAKFANGLNGGDFRIVSPDKTLVVRNVYVSRAPGSYVLPRASSLSYPQGVASTDRTVGTVYFPHFDGFYPSGWETGSIGPAGSDTTAPDGTTPISSTYSYRNIQTLKNDLSDMQTAGVDIAFVNYLGDLAGSQFRGHLGVKNLVTAHDQLSSSVKLGLFLDTVLYFHEDVLKTKDTQVDATAANFNGVMFRIIEDYFSLVPPSKVATMNGKPIILIYAPAGYINNFGSDKFDLNVIKTKFKASFGVEPYIIAEVGWDTANALVGGTPRSGVDEFFGWSAALVPSGYSGAWNNTMEVGAGFDDTAVKKKTNEVGRTRARDNGAVYDFAWTQALNRRPHLVILETWNYWVEASAVGPSDSTKGFGNTYFDKTKTYIASYKGKTYSNVQTATADLGSGVFAGVAPEYKLNYSENTTNGTVTTGTQDGRAAVRLAGDNLFFVLDDTFVYNASAGAGTFEITVTYWDGDSASGGGDALVLKWDGQSSTTSPTTDTLNNTIDIKNGTGQNTKTWKTRTFTITDAKFANRSNNRQDFYIGNAKGVWIQSISVKKPSSLVTGGVTVSDTGLHFNAPVVGAVVGTAKPITIALTTTSANPVTWALNTASAPSWLTFSKTSGSVSAAGDTVVASASAVGRSAGFVDTGSVTMTFGDGTSSTIFALLAVGNYTNTVSLPISMVSFAAGW